MKTTSIVITTLLIGATGVIAGTLFAPNKGSRTRNRIAKKGQGYKDYLVDNINDLSETVSHPFENLNEQKDRLFKKPMPKQPR